MNVKKRKLESKLESQKAAHELFAARKAAGLCIKCGGQRDSTSIICSACRKEVARR